MRLPYFGAQRTETPPRRYTDNCRTDNRRRKHPARAALSLLAAGALLFGGDLPAVLAQAPSDEAILAAVSYTHLTLPTIALLCRSRWSPYH